MADKRKKLMKNKDFLEDIAEKRIPNRIRKSVIDEASVSIGKGHPFDQEDINRWDAVRGADYTMHCGSFGFKIFHRGQLVGQAGPINQTLLTNSDLRNYYKQAVDLVVAHQKELGDRKEIDAGLETPTESGVGVDSGLGIEDERVGTPEPVTDEPAEKSLSPKNQGFRKSQQPPKGILSPKGIYHPVGEAENHSDVAFNIHQSELGSAAESPKHALQSLQDNGYTFIAHNGDKHIVQGPMDTIAPWGANKAAREVLHSTIANSPHGGDVSLKYKGKTTHIKKDGQPVDVSAVATVTKDEYVKAPKHSEVPTSLDPARADDPSHLPIFGDDPEGGVDEEGKPKKVPTGQYHPNKTYYGEFGHEMYEHSKQLEGHFKNRVGLRKSDGKLFDVPSVIADIEGGKISLEQAIPMYQHVVDAGLTDQLSDKHRLIVAQLTNAGHITTPKNADIRK